MLPLLLLSACEKDGPVPDVHVSERTVLVWLAGDNNLYSEVPHKLSAGQGENPVFRITKKYVPLNR